MRNLKKLTVISSLSAAVAVLGLSGCETHKDSERTEGRVVDDSRITHNIQSDLRNEPVFKFNEVDVKTFNGVVQLSGFVNTEDQKQRAAELAQRTAGVTQVVNGITLKPMTAPTPTGRVPAAPANPSEK
jgi:osmotically-inducible protein OsmY